MKSEKNWLPSNMNRFVAPSVIYLFPFVYGDYLDSRCHWEFAVQFFALASDPKPDALMP